MDLSLNGVKPGTASEANTGPRLALGERLSICGKFAISAQVGLLLDPRALCCTIAAATPLVAPVSVGGAAHCTSLHWWSEPWVAGLMAGAASCTANCSTT
jgi:hypothetical protein